MMDKVGLSTSSPFQGKKRGMGNRSSGSNQGREGPLVDGKMGLKILVRLNQVVGRYKKGSRIVEIER